LLRRDPTAPTPIAAPVNVVAPKPIYVNDGKNYAVKKGDTLYAIALENGLSYRDLAEWNGITNPSYIQIDQVLRLTAPTNAAAVTAPVLAQPVPVTQPGAATPVPVGTPVAAGPAPIAAPTPTLATAPATATPVSDVVWQWPSKGKLGAGFVDGKNKGIDITGNMGDAVVAAADGKVVYAGSALKGYGQMLIVKHSDVYLTAYAHNSKLLVKEDQAVKRGQKIAEMGNSESDNGQTKLHFELRRSGKPVDPLKFLPAQ
jgi:lipoprotein NlpD